MYKLVVADDEEEIRKGLCNFIDWTSLGFEVVASFADGKEVIEYLGKSKVSAILTDIKMAGISGLEVARYVHENCPDVKVIIISGYKEFELAKQAIEYGVQHYILKPTDLEEIDRVFIRIKGELNKETKEKDELTKDREKYWKLLPALREQFFIDLITGAFRRQNDVGKRAKVLELDVDPMLDLCFVIDVKIKDYCKFIEKKWVYEKGKLNTVLCEYFKGNKDHIQYYPIITASEELKVIAISSRNENQEYDLCIVEERMNKVKDSIGKLLQLEIEISIVYCFDNLLKMASYNEPVIFPQGKADIPNTKEYGKLLNKYKLIMSCINDGDFYKAENIIDSFFEGLQVLSINHVRKITVDLFSMLSNKFAQLNIPLWETMNKFLDYHEIYEMTDMDEIVKWSKNSILMITKQFSDSKGKQTIGIIEQALNFIKNNYYKDISLEEVADRVFLNPVYFSRIFKQHMGDSFIEYLTKIRINKAVEFLETGRYKVYEISEMVGYKSSKYFLRVFKLTTGYSPGDYYREVLKRSDIDEKG
jgi:Response regulator containing CheY-like receiver domain and AraC-type DNA-binding domain